MGMGGAVCAASGGGFRIAGGEALAGRMPAARMPSMWQSGLRMLQSRGETARRAATSGSAMK